jgi:hypothetical protein
MLLGEVHIEVHIEMPSTLILPDWEHLRGSYLIDSVQ